MTKLPEFANVTLFFTEEPERKRRFVHAVEFNNIVNLFKTVNYGPARVIHTKKSPDPTGTIQIHLPSEDGEIDIDGALAKRSRMTTEGTASSGTFLDRMKAVRIKLKDDFFAATKVIEKEYSGEHFSVGDISQSGKNAFISLEIRDIQLENDPDFTLFCQAIESLGEYPGISIEGISFAELPPGKRFSTLNVLPPRARKFAYVTVRNRHNTWLIIELCNKDHYSISTLLTKCSGQNEKLVKAIIDKLMISNGSWSREYFPANEYITLDHHTYRSAERWAELMYNKMI